MFTLYKQMRVLQKKKKKYKIAFLAILLLYCFGFTFTAVLLSGFFRAFRVPRGLEVCY